jgi:hypothetical protein
MANKNISFFVIWIVILTFFHYHSTLVWATQESFLADKHNQPVSHVTVVIKKVLRVSKFPRRFAMNAMEILLKLLREQRRLYRTLMNPIWEI